MKEKTTSSIIANAVDKALAPAAPKNNDSSAKTNKGSKTDKVVDTSKTSVKQGDKRNKPKSVKAPKAQPLPKPNRKNTSEFVIDKDVESVVNLANKVGLFNTTNVINHIKRDMTRYVKNSKMSNKFINDNIIPYSLVLNTWGYLIRDLCGKRCFTLFEHLLNTSGLYNTIDTAAKSFDELAKGKPISHSIWSAIYEEYASELIIRSGNLPEESPDCIMTPEFFRVMSQILKYPKRFSPNGAERLADITVKNFFKTQGRNNKWLNKLTPSNQFVFDLVREELSKMLDWDRLCREIREYLSDPFNFSLTPGSTRDQEKTVLEKIKTIYRRVTKVSTPGLPDVSTKYALYNWDYINSIPEARLACVPKNYKIWRTIAPEDVAIAARAKGVYDICLKYLEKVDGIFLENQNYSKLLALHGSKLQNYATLDATAASDTVISTVFVACFPSIFVECTKSLFSRNVRISLPNKKNFSLKMASQSTMGHALTFFIETCLFFAGDKVAKRLSFLEEQDLSLAAYITKKLTDIPDIIVYGDDQAIREDIVDAAFWVMEKLGFIINKEKSFWGPDRFREACGIECYDGEDVTPVYFPRKPIDINSNEYKIDTYSGELMNPVNTMVSLQHSLYNLCRNAANYVSYVVKGIVPSMTSSSVGMHSQDLWSVNPTFRKVPSPHAVMLRYHNKALHKRVGSIPESALIINDDGGRTSALSAGYQLPMIAKYVGCADVFISQYKQAMSLNTWNTTRHFTNWNNHALRHLVNTLSEFDTLHWKDGVFIDGVFYEKTRLFTWKKESRPESYLEAHMHCVPTYKEKILSEEEVALLDVYFYRQFLLKGVSYEHDSTTFEGALERAAGITTLTYRTSNGSYHPNLYSLPIAEWKIK